VAGCKTFIFKDIAALAERSRRTVRYGINRAWRTRPTGRRLTLARRSPPGECGACLAEAGTAKAGEVC
jgi:hypothetical protein